MPVSRAITFVATLLCLWSFTLPGSANNLLQQSSSQTLLQPQTFLPVAEAYQLYAELDGTRLSLYWSIADGYYLYKKRFRFYDSNNQALTIADVQYLQPGTQVYDEYYEDNVIVFYGEVDQVVTLEESVTDQGTIIVESQACADAGLCYPPRKLVLTYKPDSENRALDVNEYQDALVDQAPSGSPNDSQGFWLIALFALLGGLILNLMPCVFPVLSIKVLSLTTHQHSASSRLYHGVAYTSGVVLSFVVVAMVMLSLRSAGQFIGWGFQLQSPLVVITLIYLFVLMGLSFSGFFYMGSRFMSFGQNTASGDSLGASFMTGVLATVVASPCSAPFMGTAIGFTLTQSATISLIVFALLGLGMSLPFLLLICLPGLSRLLPKPGPWMETLKQLLAFPLYLSAVWLVWVLGRQSGSDLVAAVATGLVLLIFAIWITHREGTHKILGRSLATLAIVFAVLIPWNTYQQDTDPEDEFWQSYSSRQLNNLLDAGEPVFINLTADWCITCLANEKTTLNTQTVKSAFKQAGIHYLKGDWTSNNPEITELLNQQQRSGVPLYLFYPRGESVPLVLPQILNTNIVLNAIQQ